MHLQELYRPRMGNASSFRWECTTAPLHVHIYSYMKDESGRYPFRPRFIFQKKNRDSAGSFAVSPLHIFFLGSIFLYFSSCSSSVHYLASEQATCMQLPTILCRQSFNYVCLKVEGGGAQEMLMHFITGQDIVLVVCSLSCMTLIA